MAGVGLGRTFGIQMAEQAPLRTIGLVPCAVGGTPIRLWQPGEYDSTTKTHPYDDMLVRMRVAEKSGTLKGILWHQGEGDRQKGLDGSYYPALKDLIVRLRRDLDAPTVPVVIGQLGQFVLKKERHQGVDAAHKALAVHLPYVGFASSEGLVHKGDELHFDAVSARELGRRFAAEMVVLQSRSYPWGLPTFEGLTLHEELPDLMTMLDGRKVKTAADWTNRRRAELERLLCHYVYGYAPPAPANMTARVEFSDATYLGGKATLELIRLTYGTECVKPLDLLLVTPNAGAKRSPVFLGLNFHGNHTVMDHPAVPLTPHWVRPQPQGVVNNRATEEGRGMFKDRWPMELMIDRGYAVATFNQGDIFPDNPEDPNGIQSCFYAQGQTRPEPHEWGTIAAWAWGLSRAVDYLVTCDRIAPDKIAVMGHSRNGKSALLAGALDERIALVVSNQSGCGGAALSRRDVGETVKKINDKFPHWFCDTFKQFNDKEGYLPVDQHMLIALIAPRPVLICTAAGYLWEDPEGSFLALKAAEPAYKLLTGKGVSVDQMPPVNTLTDGPAAYHIRPGIHSVGVEDWQVFMDFADRCGLR
jgi:hypothetical protein